jgi:uncharacterized protein YutE (UPF0331/DUF86 family)
MVLKKETVEARLQFLRETIDKLEKLKSVPQDEFTRLYEKYWLAEHGLHLAAEAIFDISNHILVGHFGERVAGYDKVMERLNEKNVISTNIAKCFTRMGGFRNILVHEYMEIDRQKVYERIQNGLDDFKLFAQEILKWLDQQQTA